MIAINNADPLRFNFNTTILEDQFSETLSGLINFLKGLSHLWMFKPFPFE